MIMEYQKTANLLVNGVALSGAALCDFAVA